MGESYKISDNKACRWDVVKDGGRCEIERNPSIDMTTSTKCITNSCAIINIEAYNRCIKGE